MNPVAGICDDCGEDLHASAALDVQVFAQRAAVVKRVALKNNAACRPHRTTNLDVSGMEPGTALREKGDGLEQPFRGRPRRRGITGRTSSGVRATEHRQWA